MTSELDSIDVSVLSDIPDSTDKSTKPITPSMPSQHSASPSGSVAGLVRPRRRVIGNNNVARLGAEVKRNYAVAANSQFTNYTELKNDMISPEYAQEIIEEIMAIALIDTGNANATRMVEDVIFTFYIQNAASQKTGHEKVIDVYGVEFDIMVVLNVLVSHSVTPRRFTRALAARIHAFLRLPENGPLRTDLIRRYALSDPDHAALAFDGSTHIPNLPVEQMQVATMLATRGIYDNAASVKNASERTTYDGVLTGNQTGAGTLHYGNS